MTVVEFSAENHYGKAVALLNLKSGFLKVFIFYFLFFFGGLRIIMLMTMLIIHYLMKQINEVEIFDQVLRYGSTKSRNIWVMRSWKQCAKCVGFRASIADVVFVLNAIIFGIWHTKHKKQSFIRYVKYVKFLQHATVAFQFWHGTDKNGIMI